MAVLAAITMLAPSLAALRAMALPMPLLAPVMNNVWPANFLKTKRFLSQMLLRLTTYLHYFFFWLLTLLRIYHISLQTCL